MTPEQHAVELCLRLSAMKPEGEDDIANLLKWSFERAINDERTRCAGIVQEAREGERDTDLRSIIHAINNPSTPKTAEGRSE